LALAGGLASARLLWLLASAWLQLSGWAIGFWLRLVAWLLLGCFGLAAAKWLGYWLLALAWLQLSGWAIGYWLLASAIGLAAAKWLGFGFSYWLGCG